ncbi:DDE-type integrase/transposase/recombinase (plasmid) [Streptomyces sp. NBC_01591]|uniref:DDE-type integrase/transposase/recombinase n=1 Tax=Streptomyces sp. NBC_01591 TaxID=2975888 RepID=UPI002DDACD9D|nr:DDE-type integrase/transposase/recombinase [Streptomyces sp. NBC_01591]WSD74287.1 DDE-type integrase/transposase/recombinase [Streptomyces sp. NBC_01591]
MTCNDDFSSPTSPAGGRHTACRPDSHCPPSLGRTCGIPRITAGLRDGGEVVNHKRVARVMKAIDPAGLRLRRRHRTTVPDLEAAKVPDLIGRDFTATEVDTKYVGDITCLPLSGGTFRYLATVTDLASRRLAERAIADRMRTDLVIDALHAAERTRGNLTGAIFHSDRGPSTAAGLSPTPAVKPASPSP